MEIAVILANALILVLILRSRHKMKKRLSLRDQQLAAANTVIGWMEKRESLASLDENDLRSRGSIRTDAQLRQARQLASHNVLMQEESYRSGAFQAMLMALALLFDMESRLTGSRLYNPKKCLDALSDARHRLIDGCVEMVQGNKPPIENTVILRGLRMLNDEGEAVRKTA